MEEIKEEKPFEIIWAAIRDDEPLPIHLLNRLSDLSGAEYELFAAEWTAVSPDRRATIFRHLVDISEDNFVVDFSSALAFGFQDPFAPVRQIALDGLWDATDIKLIAPITQLMETDPDDGVRTAATAALSHFLLMAEWGQLPEKIIEPLETSLLNAYRQSDVLGVKKAALEALGASNHPDVPTLISEAYENGHSDMQLSALFAMGNSADKRWLVTILDELESPIEEIRAEAARASGAIGSSDAVPGLAELVLDSDLDVARAAINALGVIGGELVQQLLAEFEKDAELESLHDDIDAALEEATWLDGIGVLLKPDDLNAD